VIGRTLPRELEDAVEARIQRCIDDDIVARIWDRDPSVWTGNDEHDWLGWLDIAREQEAHLERFTSLADEVRADGFTDAVVLGMGGSSLCPEVLAATFPREHGFPRLHVLDSTDPQQIEHLEARLSLPETLFFVSSKSGTTLEPNIFAAHFLARMREAVDPERAGSHLIAITDPGSPLEAVAARDGYRRTYAGVPSIGGRYSALSDFGMVPGAATGVDVPALLASARSMADACGPSTAPRENPGMVLGAVLGTAAVQGRDKLTFITSPGVARFGGWLEQLIAESTGKHGRGIVPVDGEPVGDPGSYGDDRLFVSIALASDDDPQRDAVAALERAGQPVVRIELDDVNEIGGELFRWEFATAVAGAVIGIDPFDQPDVEEAKVLARELTDRYDETGSLDEREPVVTDGGMRLYADDANRTELQRMAGTDAGLDACVRAHVARAGAGDYVALLAYIEMSDGNGSALREIRTGVRDARRVATCVGFGPRFQHSTGQAYKGGPPTGVFIQITADDSIELPVPGHRYSFGVVKAAQAASDLAVLEQRGRRAIRLHVGGDIAAGLERLRAQTAEAAPRTG
jgi:transaldolase / glucose-6-phosphate isomerase